MEERKNVERKERIDTIFMYESRIKCDPTKRFSVYCGNQPVNYGSEIFFKKITYSDRVVKVKRGTSNTVSQN